MPSGYVAPEKLCVAKNKYGDPCSNAGSPFTDPPRCRFHGGYLPAVQAQAAKRAEEYEAGFLEPLDPPDLRRKKVAAFYATQERIERRKMKKAGILEDFDRTAARMQKEQKDEEARLQRTLGAEKYAELQRARRKHQRWLTGGRKGPEPTLPTFEPTPDPDPHAEARARGLLREPPAAAPGSLLQYDRKPRPPRQPREPLEEVRPGSGVYLQPEAHPLTPEEYEAEQLRGIETPSGVIVGRAIPYTGSQF